MTRRKATDSDMTVGATVYKGNGATAWRVYAIERRASGAMYAVTRVDSPNPPKGGGNLLHPASEFTIAV